MAFPLLAIAFPMLDAFMAFVVIFPIVEGPRRRDHVTAPLVALVTAAWVTFVTAFCVTVVTAMGVTLVLSKEAITRTIIITVLVWRFLGLFRRFLRGSGGSLFGAILFRQRLIKSLKVLDDRCWGVRRGKTIGKSFVAKQPCNQEWNQPTLGHLPYLGLWHLNSV